MTSTRAYGPWDLRQQRVATIVYTEADLHRLVTFCLQNGVPCNAVLGGNISQSATLTIPAGLSAFSLEGGGKFKIIPKGTIGALFDLQCSPCTLRDLSIALAAGAVVTSAFKINGASPAVLENVDVDASAGTLTNAFQTGGNSATRVVVDTLRVSPVANLFANEPGVFWNNCNFADVSLGAVGAANVTLGAGVGGIILAECCLDRVIGPLAVDVDSASTGNVFRSFLGSLIPASTVTTHGTGAQGNVFLGMVHYGATLSGADVWLAGGDAFAIFKGPLSVDMIAIPHSSATLNSAGPTLTPGNASFIRVTHGASASGNVTVAAGRDGQRLTLYFVSVAGTAVYTDTIGNLELAGSFTPTSADTLSLIYDASTAKWVELSRSVN